MTMPRLPDLRGAQIGNEVVVEWGDHGKLIKQVRATVERFPYLTEGRNDKVETGGGAMSIIVTGASGKFGRLVTDLLLRELPPSELILVTRRPATLDHLKRRGAQVRYGDFDDSQSLREAFVGGERMLIISTLSVGRRAEQHRRAIDAAVAVGVSHIAYTSSGGAHPDNPAIVIPDHLRTEAALKESGVAYTILRDSLYAEAVVTEIAPRMLAIGKWVCCAADGRSPFISKIDCVAVAVKVLTTPGHENKTYEVAGRELLSFRDAAALTSEMSGQPIEFVVVSDEEEAAGLAAAGVPATYVEGLNTPGVGTSAIDDIVSYEQGMRGGYFEVSSDDVQHILGRPPRSLRDVFIEHREIFQRAAAKA